MAQPRPLPRGEGAVLQGEFKDHDVLPHEVQEYMKAAGLSRDEVLNIWRTEGLYKYGASGVSTEEYTVDAPGRIGASGSAVVDATITTDHPVIVGGSGSATVVIRGNHDAVAQARGSAGFSVEYR